MSLMPFDDFSPFGYNRRILPYRSSWMNPYNSPADRLMFSALNDSLGEIQQLERQLGQLEPSIDDKGDFSFRCNVQGYRPEELKVDVHGDQLVIQGEHQHNDGRQSVHRTFKRMVALPEDVLKETVQCNIDERGRLEVRAHSKSLPGQQRKNIPIGFRKSDDQQQIGGEQQKQVEDQKK
ncbi:hsp20/alpha crystallin family domain-containing protein [Ditylenchus destructor]|uniref:Hsp20/alpha crystallin family domain-containing protein n=1 Tax=Ditylenchus destructor TaxID=166010 RepID=A0AAD4MXB9_9BILA|nr:hsp20/alpha crystallin family domain-containing protein [Ditylenchus destructor]